MKLIGTVRRIDQLGRVVIPTELRKDFDIEEKDLVEISIINDSIVISKYIAKCFLCGNNNVISFKNKLICEECLETIKTTNFIN